CGRSSLTHGRTAAPNRQLREKPANSLHGQPRRHTAGHRASSPCSLDRRFPHGWVLCEAAQTAKRSPQFAAGYQAIATRRGKKIATTAVARKLLTRAWHLRTDAERAVPQPATAPAPDKQRR